MYITVALKPLHFQRHWERFFRLLSRLRLVWQKFGSRGVSALSRMKPVPSVLFMAAVLFYTRISLSTCRPRGSSLFERHDYKMHSADVLFGALKGEIMPKSFKEFVSLSKRNDDPPISIDLTFHLLRNMIEMARNENQREQAELNRKYLDEVGK